MTKYDTSTGLLTFGQIAQTDGTEYSVWPGPVLNLTKVPESTRQVIVQMAKLITSYENGNKPHRRIGEQEYSQMEKLQKVIDRLAEPVIQSPTKVDGE